MEQLRRSRHTSVTATAAFPPEGRDGAGVTRQTTRPRKSPHSGCDGIPAAAGPKAPGPPRRAPRAGAKRR